MRNPGIVFSKPRVLPFPPPQDWSEIHLDYTTRPDYLNNYPAMTILSEVFPFLQIQ